LSADKPIGRIPSWLHCHYADLAKPERPSPEQTYSRLSPFLRQSRGQNCVVRSVASSQTTADHGLTLTYARPEWFSESSLPELAHLLRRHAHEALTTFWRNRIPLNQSPPSQASGPEKPARPECTATMGGEVVHSASASLSPALANFTPPHTHPTQKSPKNFSYRKIAQFQNEIQSPLRSDSV